jgi:hypothetical protein
VETKTHNDFPPEDRVKVGRYVAAQENCRKLNLTEGTVRYIKKEYSKQVSKHMKTGDATEVRHLEVARRGRKVALGELIDTEIQQYVQSLCDNGTSVSTVFVQTGAEMYPFACERSVLVKYGRHVSLTKDWARSLLIRMGYVKKEEFLKMKSFLLQETVATVRAHNITPELFMNLDETGLQQVSEGDCPDYGARGE